MFLSHLAPSPEHPSSFSPPSHRDRVGNRDRYYHFGVGRYDEVRKFEPQGLHRVVTDVYRWCTAKEVAPRVITDEGSVEVRSLGSRRTERGKGTEGCIGDGTSCPSVRREDVKV